MWDSGGIPYMWLKRNTVAGDGVVRWPVRHFCVFRQVWTSGWQQISGLRAFHEPLCESCGKLSQNGSINLRL